MDQITVLLGGGQEDWKGGQEDLRGGQEDLRGGQEELRGGPAKCQHPLCSHFQICNDLFIKDRWREGERGLSRPHEFITGAHTVWRGAGPYCVEGDWL